MAVAVTAGPSFKSGSPVALFQTHRREPVSALDSLFLRREWRRAKIPNHQEGGRSQCRAALHPSKLGLAGGEIEADSVLQQCLSAAIIPSLSGEDAASLFRSEPHESEAARVNPDERCRPVNRRWVRIVSLAIVS